MQEVLSINYLNKSEQLSLQLNCCPKRVSGICPCRSKVEAHKRSKDKWMGFIGLCTKGGDDINQLMVRH